MATTGEITTEKQDTSQETEKALAAKQESTSKKTPLTYTEDEYIKGVSDALTTQGREHKVVVEAITSERDTLKSGLAERQTTLESSQSERDTLKTQLDNLTKDAPEKFDLVTRDNELRAQEKKIKDDLKTLTTEQGTHAEKLKLADDVTREITVIAVATDYKDSNMAKLSDLCNQLNLNTEEQIRKVADSLWEKTVTEEKLEEKKQTTQMKPTIGVTMGGKEDHSGDTPDDKIKEGLAKLKAK